MKEEEVILIPLDYKKKWKNLFDYLSTFDGWPALIIRISCLIRGTTALKKAEKPRRVYVD